MTIGMATVTLTGSLVRSNRALATLLGRTAPELIGMAYSDLMDKRGDLFGVGASRHPRPAARRGPG